MEHGHSGIFSGEKFVGHPSTKEQSLIYLILYSPCPLVRLSFRLEGLACRGLAFTPNLDIPRPTSALSPVISGVEFAKFDSGLFGGELPLGFHLGLVAALGPGLEVLLQIGPLTHPLGQIARQGT